MLQSPALELPREIYNHLPVPADFLFYTGGGHDLKTCVTIDSQDYGLLGRDALQFGGQVPIFGRSYRRCLQDEKLPIIVYLCIRRWALYSIPGVEMGFSQDYSRRSCHVIV